MRLRNLLGLAALAVPIGAQLAPKDVLPHAFILTDISNEPDDAESLVRALLYSNEIDIRGIVATTSYWLNSTIHDEDIYPILDAYEKVHPKLLLHSPNFPSAEYFRSIVSTGYPVYGLASLEYPEISKGAANLIKQVDSLPANETMWVLVWGGAAVLAESLTEVSKTRSKKDEATFLDKIKVYSISDQDDAGAWIRYTYPHLFYIASVHGFNQYALSSWVGISGEFYNKFDKGGPDRSLVSKEWLQRNIQVGPLGKAYPEYMFNMEGDTPSLLHIIPNGLNDPDAPRHGGWGGRYDLVDISGRFNLYGGVTDHVVGQDGELFCSDKATIWRWRDAYQNDFAARMQWTIKPFEKANHAPVAVVNGTDSVKPLELFVAAGSRVYLDASESYDIDGDSKLDFNWFHYRDVTLTQSNIMEVAEIEIDKSGSKASFDVPDFQTACFNPFGIFLGEDHCKSYHIILEVTDSGSPPLKGYKRIILRTHPDQKEKSEDSENSHDEL
ncbi:unnamed protein product [Kuraishia capsulata CBS 1993]|uniref:DUF1593 domain-containing protein n=1 Tax=Kuraishia capsulata CBS 1993 TaxID=1382522 RepID=W6MV40_9ASCO|nr:uncharacterized protein KUCA_T00002026001 [Kuraishia capsulata CBS 1993]CDK26055.1 unnamed protein product [Kuraishia capsulata CBS 1993]